MNVTVPATIEWMGTTWIIDDLVVRQTGIMHRVELVLVASSINVKAGVQRREQQLKQQPEQIKPSTGRRFNFEV